MLTKVKLSYYLDIIAYFNIIKYLKIVKCILKNVKLKKKDKS